MNKSALLKLLVILGPTATGKTDAAINLAKKFNGELVAADSRQIYSGLDIGSGKMPSSSHSIIRESGRWVVDNIPINLYDIADPKDQYSVNRFIHDASASINEITERGELPILVGGTGLYIRGLLHGLSLMGNSFDETLRQELDGLSKEVLQNKLQEIDPERWLSLNESDKQNPRRLIRQIELALSPKPNVSSFMGLENHYDVLKIGLTMPREDLYRRIDMRVDGRIKSGLIEEGKRLHAEGLTLKRMHELGLEYGILAEFLEGRIVDEDAFAQRLKYQIHKFARRQLTWFKKEQGIIWFDISNEKFLENMTNIVNKWYYNNDVAKN